MMLFNHVLKCEDCRVNVVDVRNGERESFRAFLQ